jgi:uncharacterized protein YoxC
MAAVAVSEVAALQIAAAIKAQTLAMETQWTYENANTALLLTELEMLRQSIAGVVDATGEIASQAKGTSKAISDLNSAIGSVKSAVTGATAVMQSVGASTIKTNNLMMDVTKQGLETSGQTIPEQKPMLDQLKETVVDGLTFHQQVSTQNVVSTMITDSINAVGGWITGMAVYQSVAGWATNLKDSFVAAITPDPKKTARTTTASAGLPPAPLQ